MSNHDSHEAFARHRAKWRKTACAPCAMGIAYHLASLEIGEGPYNWRRTQIANGYLCTQECGQQLWEGAFTSAPKPAPVAARHFSEPREPGDDDAEVRF